MFRARQVASQFVASEEADGVGALVRRSIGSRTLRSLDPFLLLDEFNVGLPGGFPDHPHRGFDTVTYMLPTSKGHILHEDFLGNKGELRGGDLQWMTPGRGILHAEMPASIEPAHGLQLWINLPKSRKFIEPQYQEISHTFVPHAFDAEGKIEAIVFAGEVFGQKGPIETQTPVTYIHFILSKGAKLEYPLPVGHNAFVYTLSGSGMTVGQKLIAQQATVLEKEGDGLEVTSEEDVEFIVISGEPLNEPVFHTGLFAMNTENEVQEALQDFRDAQNGFETADTWRSSIMPKDLPKRQF